VHYPIRTANPARLHAELQSELAEANVGERVTAATWDTTAKTCLECIARIEKRDTKRRNAVIHKLNAQNRAHLFTRRDLMEATAVDIREEHLIRMGQRLERTTDQLRWRFKRISNWEKDQTIEEIQQINGSPFTRAMSISNCFASEWRTIFGAIHNALAGDELEREFDDFVSIPPERRLSDAQNADLIQPITSEEVIQAIAALSRHKAAGGDGLNNDFFKDHQALLVNAMVAIGNELLQGAEPPASFLEGLIIPLRKKGDSANAMNFRPISLLQTGYKVFTKVLATRAQRVMETPIGDSQQGFVHGRQMMKTVMMMLAMLATAAPNPDLEAAMSRVILLLDFRKAYDTVVREFLFLVLEKFGFSKEFVNMIRRLHNGTTARFLVNGELSDLQDVVSGIRQGCPLAPLLFILAAEILALAIRQDKQIERIDIPGGSGQRYVFSAFVDDSTVFLNKASQLPRVMALVKRFGQLSGLQVQPTKSHVIFLNTVITADPFNNIPVLRMGDTVRYLGHEVGTGELTDINWAMRIRSVQRRLATAAQLATSLENRVQILNVIMLPSVLFTAAVFDLPDWSGTQLRNIQKQFLWYQATSTDAARHKINPGLLFTPKPVGGVGLASIALACKTQRVKPTMLWLIQRQDTYYLAWRSWMWRGIAVGQFQGISSMVPPSRGGNGGTKSPGVKLQQLMGQWVASTSDEGRQQRQSIQETTISWAADDEWTLELPSIPIRRQQQSTKSAGAFWSTYCWANNPKIRDSNGRTLNRPSSIGSKSAR
jgi:hypothetical protein